MSETVYFNGKFILKDNAFISPDDRGFLFADGVYEVIKYYNGKPFRLDDHMQRLKRSLDEVQINWNDLDFNHPEMIFSHLLKKNNLMDTHAGIYLQVTRGEFKRVHYFPENIKPTVYAYSFLLPSFSDGIKNGIKVITQQDIRWLRCDIKSISLLPNTMLFNQAVKKGAGESILIRDGVVTEATHSSVLGVKNGVVVTHPLTNLILPGITRQVILEICRINHIEVEERAIQEKELTELDELMIAGTGSEIIPVIQVNNDFIGNKKPGEITRFLQQKFFELT